jgi:glutamyl-tRNA reductase
LSSISPNDEPKEEAVKILLIGLSHKTAPVEVRERLAFTPATLRSALTHFDTIHSQAHLTDVREGVILSTCNRLEVYALVRDPQIAKESLINFLSQSCNVPRETFFPYLYVYHDEEAVRHLMYVAAGLDSMVLGEPQILGQVTEAFQAALAQDAAGTVLSALFRAAILTGKRVRTETGIGVNAASISSVAASLASQLLGDLVRQQVLLVGAGEMGVITVRALLKRGVSRIVVANRTYQKAVEVAQGWRGRAINFQQLPAALTQADIVITCTSAPHTILNCDLLEPAMATRPNRPLFIIDIAVPRDVDPNVTELPQVYLCNIDDLQDQANENLREREAEIPHAETIVADEIKQFQEWLSSLEATSTITALRQQIELVRQQELQRIFNRLELDERQQKLITAMSNRLVNKILHEPTLCLKKEAANGNGAAYIATVRQLFSLDNLPIK